MSGPVASEDVPSVAEGAARVDGAVVEVEPARVSQVGTLPVRRVLPHRWRRTVGAWCFADHVGPVSLDRMGGGGAGIGPHPHTGLQTVTWVLSGELVHLDSLGSEQPIRPGELNLMTAGHGVAHAEEDPGRAGELHAVQLWVAQPESTRHAPPTFEHHTELPGAELDGATATVFVGEFAGATSPARRDSDHVGVDLALARPGATVPLRAVYEHALIVLEGSVRIDGVTIDTGVLAYLGEGRDECRLEVTAPTRALVLGGVPFPEPLLMWWNFVARSREEVSEARNQWAGDDARFGSVASSLARIEVGRPPWE